MPWPLAPPRTPTRGIAISLALLMLAASACSHGAAASGASPSPKRARTGIPGEPEKDSSITLVESAPIETTLDSPDVPNADGVWKEMIGSARRSLDIAEFYASDETNTRLTPVIQAILEAADRGVRVRFLVDKGFSAKYPKTVAQLAAGKDVEVRRIDIKKRTGGVQHAKYFVVDRRDSYVGSQNFDWRSLEHIQELGVRLRSKTLSGALLDVFETDWELAEGAPADFRALRRPLDGPVKLASGETVTFLASPKAWLPDEQDWDLPMMIKLLDGATREVGVQLLTYSTKGHDGSIFTDLDEALRRAAGRGVRVRLLVSDWSNKTGSEARASIVELSKVKGVEVKVITIPKWSGGDIPFARVCHSKFFVVDQSSCWIGTSNWEGSYFFKARNVGVIVESAPFSTRLGKLFEDTWASTYSAPVER